MKKFYCLYNRNNLPFSWKLKQANEKPIANFKSREDCLNYYLSFNNVGIIWFQKANSKATRRENLKDSFDGYIKSEMKNGVLIHVIGVVPGTTENAARILKRNLFHSLQIDPETGRDLLDEKGIDRLYNNKNSYLIFDKDIAEEISTVYDAKPIKIEKEDVEKNIDDTTPIDAQHSPSFQSSSPEILRDIVKNSPSNIKNEEVNEKDIVLDIEVEYNEPAKPKSDDYDFNENIVGNSNNYNNYNNYNNTGGENFAYPPTQPYNNFNGYNHNYQNNNLQNNYGMWNRGNFGVNINDFNFKNDFGNYKLKIQPARSRYLLNNNFGNNFNNNGKILKNNFYKLYGSGGAIMNSNSNKFNTTNLGGSNDVWVPVGQPNNPNMQRPYGTIEFTAVPNQMLNTELNPLGANTMIFNPYSMQNPMQNQFPNLQSNSNNSSETLIQPIIQPIIQTVYQQQNKTTVLEPIVNDPIMADGSPYNPYNDYSQYANTALLNVPKQYDTSEFRFNNNVENTNSFPRNNNERNFNSTAQQMVNAPAPTVSQTLAPTDQPIKENLDQNTPLPVAKKAVKEVSKKSKNSKKMLYSFMFISLLVMVAIIVVIILFVTGVIVI